MLRGFLQRHVGDPEMDRLVLLVVGVGQEHRRQPVEGELAVGPWIGDRLELGGGLEGFGVAFAVAERAEQREAQGVGPHVEAAEPDAQHGAESRPQRLGVAHLPQVVADRRRPPRRLVVGQLIIPAAAGERLRHMLGRKHARQHGVVAALDARHVDEAGRAADQRAARKREPGDRLIAALRDGARPVADALAAREGVAHQRVGLEALEFLERRQIGIIVIEMNNESDRHQVVVIVIEKRAAAGGIVERPAETVLHQAGPMPVGRDLPEFFQPDAEFRRLPAVIEPVARDQRLAQIPARSFRKESLDLPSRPTPMSRVATPTTSPLAPNSTSAAAKPG